MNINVKREQDNTITLKITVPWDQVEKTRQEVVSRLIRNIQVAGFRIGKAPKKVAEQKLSKELVREELLKQVLTEKYSEAIKAQNISPIIAPRIHVEAFDEGTDLKFEATTCEEPHVDLKNYKDDVQKVTAKAKIILPGKEGLEQNKPSFDEIIHAVLNSTTATIPKILIEQETNRLLSQLIDELKALGLSLEQYLASRGKTGDQLRTEYEQKAERDLKLEFLLRKIADTEKIAVEQKDIDEVLNSVKEENEKKKLSANPYLLAAIIRQQKTLDFLSKM